MEGISEARLALPLYQNHPSAYGGYVFNLLSVDCAKESSLRIWRVYLRKSTFFDGRWVLYTMIQFNFLPEHTDHPRMHAPSQFQHAMLAAMHPNQ